MAASWSNSSRSCSASDLSDASSLPPRLDPALAVGQHLGGHTILSNQTGVHRGQGGQVAKLDRLGHRVVAGEHDGQDARPGPAACRARAGAGRGRPPARSAARLRAGRSRPADPPMSACARSIRPSSATTCLRFSVSRWSIASSSLSTLASRLRASAAFCRSSAAASGSAAGRAACRRCRPRPRAWATWAQAAAASEQGGRHREGQREPPGAGSCLRAPAGQQAAHRAQHGPGPDEGQRLQRERKVDALEAERDRQQRLEARHRERVGDLEHGQRHDRAPGAPGPCPAAAAASGSRSRSRRPAA